MTVVPDWVLWGGGIALPLWMLMNLWLAFHAGTRWGWRWGLGLWLVLPVAVIPWLFKWQKQRGRDRDLGVRRPVGT